MKPLFNITFKDQVQNSTKRQLFSLLLDLHGKTGRTVDIMRKIINKELNHRLQ